MFKKWVTAGKLSHWGKFKKINIWHAIGMPYSPVKLADVFIISD